MKITRFVSLLSLFLVASCVSSLPAAATPRAPAESTAPQARVWKVFECRDAQGRRAFRDVPCARSETSGRTLALKERKPSLALRKQLKWQQTREARLIAAWERASASRLPASLGGKAIVATPVASPARPRGADACAIARDDRDRAYRERGNSMEFDERRALLDRIGLACASR